MGEEIIDKTNPDYYKNETSLECIDAMLLIFGEERVYNFCICNAWKYIWRWRNKNGHEDLEKALWYIDEARGLKSDSLYDDVLIRMGLYIQLELAKEKE